jgi:2-hydroxychromene-2-carboxylate isomerase
MKTLHFYYDVVCPYAFLASTGVESLAARAGAKLVWEPVLLGGIYQAIEGDQNPSASMNPNKARLNILDMLRMAVERGSELNHHPEHPLRTVNAMRLILAASEDQRAPLSKALFRAYHIESRAIDKLEVLAEFAETYGVDMARLEDPAIKAELRQRSDDAAALGLFGVPAYRVGDEFWWGGDREHFALEALGGPRAVQPSADGPVEGREVEFFHDFSSPFSYLASTQIERIAREAGATVAYRPMLLGAIFREIGTPDVPLLAMNQNKQRYYSRDLTDWASWWDVPFDFNSHFPLRTVTALRVALQEPRTTPLFYAAIWAEDRNFSDEAVIREILEDGDFDAEQLIAGCQDPAIKAELRSNTERAVALGACGAPTFRVGEAIFWGQDRMQQVRRALLEA